MSSLLMARAAMLLRRFRGSRRGSAAIEFAMVAPIFFGLLFAIIETAFMFFAGQVLETAVQDSARLILTGQAQNASYSSAQFKTALCGKLSSLFDCNGVYVDVRSYGSDFSTVSIVPPIDANKNFVNTMQYNPGTAGQIVVVRAFYQWPLFVTGLGYNIANLTDSKRLLTATAAFRNEPYN
ncbi:pilus assembly protein [Rhodopseudomonas palustris]|jgi:Flp pilus assembly protein TadG|uniref:TadE/TadG family type IV pilus assembly protein n=1 Tax=Rhodopseudomonas palustris TaxID=1076 RepID=UPI0020CFE2B3|nr:TadE/TadG family type IV pilus assembly protein [Rhodopseudomonas palustris]MCP9629925.1 pilus assembly protein [Rhodopseudomonas palustris]